MYKFKIGDFITSDKWPIRSDSRYVFKILSLEPVFLVTPIVKRDWGQDQYYIEHHMITQLKLATEEEIAKNISRVME